MTLSMELLEELELLNETQLAQVLTIVREKLGIIALMLGYDDVASEWQDAYDSELSLEAWGAIKANLRWTDQSIWNYINSESITEMLNDIVVNVYAALENA